MPTGPERSFSVQDECVYYYDDDDGTGDDMGDMTRLHMIL